MLYLVRHAKARPKQEDPDQHLSEEGRAEAECVARVARSVGLQVSRIEHSGKPRARETAELFADYLHPPGGVAARRGLNPLDDVAALAPSLHPEHQLLLVSHLPFLEKLAARLITGKEDPPVIAFPTAGLVALDYDTDTNSWFIAGSVFPGFLPGKK